jgi:hypothetical protein
MNFAQRKKIADTLVDYSNADLAYQLHLNDYPTTTLIPDHHCFWGDEEFWHWARSGVEVKWGTKISLRQFVLSHWVPRVPGLYCGYSVEADPVPGILTPLIQVLI